MIAGPVGRNRRPIYRDCVGHRGCVVEMQLVSLFCKVIPRLGQAAPATACVRQLRHCSSEAPLQRTVLYDFHVRHGGKMVPFAGYEMPVQYGSMGIAVSHLHTRKQASLFDVSHMLQSKLHGEDRVKFVESLVVSDIEGLVDDSGTLTVYTTETGGIIDDLIVNKAGDHLYVVSNAGCRDKDLAHVRAKLSEFQAAGGRASLEVMDDWALLAVQGPATARLLGPLVDKPLEPLTFMRSALVTIAGIPNCRITRCGYTGEDGVEISVPAGRAEELASALVGLEGLELAGLGARDTLRLEAGLCLYGQDIGMDTSPVEAGLVFTIGKRRRQTADFPGAKVILEQLAQKPARKRVGIVAKSGAPARCGAPIYDESGQKALGAVTSGCPSPSVGANIAMGYVPTASAKIGTPLQLQVRGKMVPAVVAKMPFVPTHYYTPPKTA